MIRVLQLTAEVTPWASSGGLGNVMGALPDALQRTGQAQVATFTPLYRSVWRKAHALGIRLEPTGHTSNLRLGSHRLTARFWRHRTSAGAQQIFVDVPALFDREGIYDHGDNAARFAFFTRAAIAAAPWLMGGRPHVIHGHDWPTAGAPLARHEMGMGSVPFVLTVHNLAHQGWFPRHEIEMFGWQDPPLDYMGGHDVLNWLKGGIAWAHQVTTVSPNYAREVCGPDHGFGLDGLLREKGVVGLVNGIDTDEWNPATDRHIEAPFHRGDLSGKHGCKQALRKQFGLRHSDEPVVGVVSRLVSQKGLDLMAQVAWQFERWGLQLVLLGSGDPDLADAFRELARRFPDRIGVHIGFEPSLAHQIMAGADMTVMPSRFEPCGLTQMYAMRYGTVPIVHPVGGLNDTVFDPGEPKFLQQGTGIRFFPLHAETLARALLRARHHFADRAGWGELQQRIMGQDWSWDRSAQRYVDLYRSL